MVFWIARSAILMNLIFTINSLNYSNTTKRVSAAIIGDFKIGFLVSVRLHTPGRKNTRNLECGKVSGSISQHKYVRDEWSLPREFLSQRRLTIKIALHKPLKVN